MFRRLLIAALLVVTGCGAEEPSAPPVRIVLVTLDTLRYDAVFGPRACMPTLAALAARGTVFHQAYSATSTTQPSHASLFTGLHPWEHGVTRNSLVLAEDFTTLAERLSAAGFATAGVAASLPMHSRFGWAQGFQHYDDHFNEVRAGQREWADVAVPGEPFSSFGEDVTARGLAALAALRGDRQFLWVHYFDAHAPYGDTGDTIVNMSQLVTAARYQAPELPALITEARRLYEADARAMDAALGRLLAQVEAEAGRFETHIVVTADHGESLGDDGSFGHGKSVNRQQVHVPLIVFSPRLPAGAREDASASVDIADTLLALAGQPPLPGSRGRSLLRPLPAEASPPIVGMRRIYEEPTDDVLADGRVVPVQGPMFFIVRDGQLHHGDATSLTSEAGGAAGAKAGAGGGAEGGAELGAEPVDEAAIRRLFAAFQAALESGGATEIDDEETRAAMSALGYTR
ncbi:MAG: sulfatase [Planctomycetota bacterium]